MKTALRLLTLALCVFAWIENSMLTAKPQPCKPSPIVASDPIFHREAIQVETKTIGGEAYKPKFLEMCPAGRNCI